MSSNRNFFLALILVGVSLASLDVIGVIYTLFWRMWWYDIPMHMLGGLFVSLAVFPFIFYLGVRNEQPRKVLLWWVFCFSALIGVGWEFLELATHSTSLSDSIYFFDTGKDIVNDSIGSLGGLYILGRLYASRLV